MLPSSAEHCAFLLTKTQTQGIWGVFVCERNGATRKRERCIVDSPFMSISQNWNNEFPVWFTPYLPPMVCSNVKCCSQKGRTTHERVRKLKTTLCKLSSFHIFIFYFNDLSPPTTKDITLSTDKRRRPCWLHKLHHKEPHSLYTHRLGIQWSAITVTFSLGYLAVGNKSAFWPNWKIQKLYEDYFRNGEI